MKSRGIYVLTTFFVSAFAVFLHLRRPLQERELSQPEGLNQRLFHVLLQLSSRDIRSRIWEKDGKFSVRSLF